LPEQAAILGGIARNFEGLPFLLEDIQGTAGLVAAVRTLQCPTTIKVEKSVGATLSAPGLNIAGSDPEPWRGSLALQ
jgi:hypothetical protein